MSSLLITKVSLPLELRVLCRKKYTEINVHFVSFQEYLFLHIEFEVSVDS